MYVLPSDGFIRLNQIIGDPDSGSPIIPVRKSTWWAGCKSGRFPKPTKLGANTTAWRVEDVRKLIDSPGDSWKEISHES